MNLEQILAENNLTSIARFIFQDWKNVNFGAKPYLDAMLKLNKITDDYHEDSAKTVVTYFLANATGYRGENARTIKKHLNKLCNEN